jgi:magnesium-transporting ATPase (P-type)
MLELIMALSLVLRKYSDLAVVSALLVVNAVLSFAQERRAAGVVETLRRRLQVGARVRRDSIWQIVPARELVPGDIVRVRSGDIVPADVKLLTGVLGVDQSALTGESKDVEKAAGDVLSSGSVVRRGEGNGLVMLTGASTYFGRTTELVQQARPKLHIEAAVAKVVRWLFVIVGVLLGVVIIISLVRGAQLIEMVPLMLVLLMSAVPVALPVMFTVSMAYGSKELARRGVLVTRLSAAEDAATMDVLCVDKTGTITMNQLAVTGVIPLDGATEKDVLLVGALASQEANQDPIDMAFLAAARDRRIRHFDIGDALDAGNEIGRILIAARMRRIFVADAADRIATQRHDVAHAGSAIAADHLVDLGAGRGNASEMRGGRQRGFAQNALDGRVRALAGRAAGAVCHGYEARGERRQPCDRFPQRLVHLLGLRREELEGDVDAATA